MQHVASLSLKEYYIRLFHVLCLIEYTIRKRGGNRWLAGAMEGRNGGWWMDNGRARGAENGRMKRNKLVK